MKLLCWRCFAALCCDEGDGDDDDREWKGQTEPFYTSFSCISRLFSDTIS